MKKATLIITALLLLGISFKVDAQAKWENKLLNLYIDEDWAKLKSSALSVTENDKYKKEPLPYLYVSIAYFEMSKNPEYAEKEPKAFKYAMKYAVKWRKKDKQNELYDEYYDTYFFDLKNVMIEEAQNYYDEGVAKKAMYNMKQMTGFSTEDYTAWFFRAMCEVKLQMSTEAVKHFAQAVPQLVAIPDFEEYPEEQQGLLKYCLMKYSDDLIESGLIDSAKTTIDIGYKYFENDEAYKRKYDEIKNK